MAQVVFVGLSGGVDSSVAAALLQRDGYKVVGVFMKNWSRDVGGMHCPWKEDLASARSVAAHLRIELKVYDFEQQYFDTVARYMIDTYQRGLTPNPDIMCNAEIKFKVFAERCFGEGAGYIATGHYARIDHQSQGSTLSESPVRIQRSSFTPHLRASILSHIASGSGDLESDRDREIGSVLCRAIDSTKDQTYFLYRAPQETLNRTLFPLGELPKSKVRELAVEFKLPTAARPDSQGLCFVGNIPMRTFLSEFIEPQAGDIVDEHGKVVGQHDGAFFYTIGQRHGLGVGGGQPYFVYKLDVGQNIVHVTTNPESLELNSKKFAIGDCHWYRVPQEGKEYSVQVRYRTLAKPGKLVSTTDGYRVELDELERAITPGQSAVVYDGDVVLGGGIII